MYGMAWLARVVTFVRKYYAECTWITCMCVRCAEIMSVNAGYLYVRRVCLPVHVCVCVYVCVGCICMHTYIYASFLACMHSWKCVPGRPSSKIRDS
jgi:hypothetical protein